MKYEIISMQELLLYVLHLMKRRIAMGRAMKILSPILLFALICTILVIPIIQSEEVATANSYPWADVYGFKYPEGYWSSEGVNSYSYYHGTYVQFSGTDKYWSSSYPCTKQSLMYRNWPTTSLINSHASRARTYIYGNALFAFFGHGSGSGNSIQFYDGSGYSYITQWHVLHSFRYLDDMKFIFLLACQTATGDNMTARFRCHRGVDMAFGVASDFSWKTIGPYGGYYCYAGHVYNTEFWRSVEINPGSTVLASMQYALNWTNYHCNGSKGLQNHALWGAENDTVDYLKIVGDGEIELPPGS